MEYKILDSVWHTCMIGLIGVVATQFFEETWRAYIGSAPGLDENYDSKYIAANGAKLSKKIAAAYFPHLDIENYGE